MKEEKRVSIEISTNNSNNFIIEWFNSMLIFIPKEMQITGYKKEKYLPYSQEEFTKAIAKISDLEKFDIVYQNEFNSVRCFKNHNSKDVIIVSAIVTYELFLANYDKFLQFMKTKFIECGIVAKVTDLDDYVWQNNRDINMYKYRNKSIEGIPLVDSERFRGRKEVDVEKMSGYGTRINNIWFGAVWQMWFNKPYFSFVPKECIEEFRDCYSNEKISEGCIHITLYKDVDAYDLPENRSRQWKFKEAINFDETVKKLKTTGIGKDDNPSIEIETGSFNHGGVRQIYTYLNNEMQSATKSTATKVEVIEYDSKGNILWKNTQDLKN